MKKKAIKLYGSYHRKAIYYADHLAICSCAMCGNPRKYFGKKTIQERKYLEDGKHGA